MSEIPFFIKVLASLGIVKIKTQLKPTPPHGVMPYGFNYQPQSKTKRRIKIPSDWIIPVIILLIGAVLIFGVLPNMINKNHVVPDATIYQDSSLFIQNLKKEALPFEEMYTNRLLSQTLKDDLQRQKTLIDRASCDTLLSYYNTNTGWMSRPYMAYKLLDLHCV